MVKICVNCIKNFQSPIRPFCDTLEDYGYNIHGILLVGIQAILRQELGVSSLPGHALLDGTMHSAKPDRI